MPQSLTKVLLHIVFSTKHRQPLIDPAFEDRLCAYVNGIIHKQGCKLLIAGGTVDHIHLLVSLSKQIFISTLIGHIKRESSIWVKANGGPRDFYWQEGYGVFSIGQSQVQAVTKYIATQKQHHAKQGFQDEFRSFLQRYQVEYDERYVWD
ncbi:MAG: IS200/IS605 family transposase [Acidobacteria bacterium]|nr:IS200/IS605 family transposase [Acidobacteriota bacterium]